ncbi:MAG: transcriptional repressor [Lachnospiraceae bacterium]
MDDKKAFVIQELKKHGCRITEQRKLLIDIILKDECCSCKEMYYQALALDSSIGMATVYRMVKTLEEIGLIAKKNMYQIRCDAVTA